MQLLYSTDLTNILRYLIQEMPFSRSNLRKWVLCKALEAKCFEINNTLHQLFDLSFSPSETSKCNQYGTEDVNLLCIQLGFLVIITTGTEVNIRLGSGKAL